MTYPVRPLHQSKTSNSCRDAQSVRPSPLKPTAAVTFDTTDAQIVRPYKGYSSRASLHFATRQMGYKSLLGRKSGSVREETEFSHGGPK